MPHQCLLTGMWKRLSCTPLQSMNGTARSGLDAQRRRHQKCKTKLGQGNVFTGICDSVHRGGVCLSACLDTPGSRHPPEQTPPRPDPPDQKPYQSRHHPPRSRHHPPRLAPPPPPAGRSRLWHTVNEWPVRILLECILVLKNLLN